MITCLYKLKKFHKISYEKGPIIWFNLIISSIIKIFFSKQFYSKYNKFKTLVYTMSTKQFGFKDTKSKNDVLIYENSTFLLKVNFPLVLERAAHLITFTPWIVINFIDIKVCLKHLWVISPFFFFVSMFFKWS